jgi:hypothetical protein
MNERSRAAAACLAAALAATACEVPTELPLWDTEWDVVVVSDTVSTAELVPEGVRVSEQGFVVDSFDTEGQVRLGDVCELCTCFDGPIPPVEIAPHDWPVELPPGVRSANIVRGTARVVIHNEVGFDVLDDGAGNHGFLEVALTDSWTDEVLETLRVEEPFPPGDSLLIAFDLPAVELSSRIVARVRGRTPGTGCDSVPLTPESGFRTTVSLQDVVADTVEVFLTDADLALPTRDWALPEWLRDRLRPGDAEAILDVRIESSVPAAFELDLSAAGSAPDLFTGTAALYTPLLLPAGGTDPVTVHEAYLVDLRPLADAERLWVAGRTTVDGSRLVALGGGEAVAYRVRLLATLPTR